MTNGVKKWEPLKSGSILDYQIHGYLPNHFDSIWAIYTTFILVSFYMLEGTFEILHSQRCLNTKEKQNILKR